MASLRSHDLRMLSIGPGAPYAPCPLTARAAGPGFGWGKNPPTGGAGRPNLGGKYHHAAGVFSVQMASKKGGRRAPPCSWTNARMGGSPVEPILVQGMTCAWCVGEGGAPYKSRPKAVPPAKGGPSRARGPRGVVHRGATTSAEPSNNLIRGEGYGFRPVAY